jgi:hypothetical protein
MMGSPRTGHRRRDAAALGTGDQSSPVPRPIRYGPTRDRNACPFQLKRTVPSNTSRSTAACTVGIIIRQSVPPPAAVANTRAASLGQIVAFGARAESNVRMAVCASIAAVIPDWFRASMDGQPRSGVQGATKRPPHEPASKLVAKRRPHRPWRTGIDPQRAVGARGIAGVEQVVGLDPRP